jgi:hypothetical protein
MKEMQWKFLDKTTWGEGPWNSEPDKVQWTDPATGLPCMIHRAKTTGSWCGYVGVGSGHPHYGIHDFSEIPVSVHGGITFADKCDPGFNPETGEGICHIPEPGEPDDVYWFGFDCGHAFDLMPAMHATMREIGFVPTARGHITDSLWNPETYRDIDYVRSECTILASQLAVLIEPAS